MSLAFECNFMGVPVWRTPEPNVLAHTRGIWPWKKIVVGPAWKRLSHDEQIAVLLHEIYHVKMFHVEQRLLALPLLWLPCVKYWAGRQELACDAYVARNGFGVEMVRVLRSYYRQQPREQFEHWYPHPGVRVQRLLTEIDRYNYAT